MNLDALCAQCGDDIVRDVAPQRQLFKKDKPANLENTITKSLGVLQQDGVYAFFLFLDYFQQRSENQAAGKAVSLIIANRTKELLRAKDSGILRARQQGERDDFAALRDLSKNLDSLLLARQLLEQALIYARYHAKALEVKD
jgi:hypothetical protein